SNYWFSTGTPTFLINAIKEKDIPVIEFENIEADDTIFESFDIDNMELTSLLFQTGYLTIKEKFFCGGDAIYRLSYPNKEVRDSFLKHLLKGFTERQLVENLKILRKLKSSINRGDLDTFFEAIKSMFASIPYNVFVDNREGYYSSIIYLLLQLSGIEIQLEKETNIGRIDAVAITENQIYIMEFKIGTSEVALKQIKEKKYYEPYLTSDKSIVLIGVGIDPKIRNITDFRVEPWNP
ncbi:MAG TPA: PD-(D/E)XK nuclease domain-containing protein, partial [Candidatus Kapabacteria bacterium]|nr:PD-(D/E)XK nuclease domain-containing protein [Candidatus Kapabacteria bacterium]